MEFFTIEDQLIHCYTRGQATTDGMLIDISQAAVEFGFKAPVAMTRAAWADCVEWSQATADRKAISQNEEDRLWDVVYMAMLAARHSEGMSRTVFDLYRVSAIGKSVKPRRTSLVLQIGPGDSGEPVLTIALPGEV